MRAEQAKLNVCKNLKERSVKLKINSEREFLINYERDHCQKYCSKQNKIR